MKKKITATLDEEVLGELSTMAEKSGRSVSSVMNDILKGGLDSRMQMLQELETVNILDLVKNLKRSLSPKG